MAMTLDALGAAVDDGTIDTVIVAWPDLYGRLLGKRLDARYFLGVGRELGTHACDYLFTVDIEMEVVDGYEFASWDGGYGDVEVRADLSTLRVADWAERSVIVLGDVVHARGDISVAPRNLLRRHVERLNGLGLGARAASELEFYLYRDSYRAANTADYRDLAPGGWYSEDYDLLQGGRHEPYLGAVRRSLNAAAVPVESTKGETGVGQHELNLAHAELFEMADRHAITKFAMKSLAETHGISVTFMAKPSADDAGSGCHLHLSVSDSTTGRSAIVDDAGAPSQRFRWFLGGWMRYVADFMVFYAPTVNSYKRYADASWAPTRVAWATDNRTAGFRIVGHGQNFRIECRIPGADCNPYLAYTAALASGCVGIEQCIEPPAELTGDAYRSDPTFALPTSLEDATARFEASDVVEAALGTGVQRHYAHFFDTEAAHWRAAVTDWERRRYFERV